MPDPPAQMTPSTQTAQTTHSTQTAPNGDGTAAAAPAVTDELADRRERALQVPTPRFAGGKSPGWLRKYRAVLVGVDALCLVAVMVLAELVRLFGTVPPAPVTAALSVGWLLTLAGARAYDTKAIGAGPEEYKRVGVATVRFWACLGVVAYLAEVGTARGLVAVALPAGLVVLILGRYVARRWLYFTRRRTSAWSHRILVVGDRMHVLHLTAQLRREPYAGFHVVGACLPGGPQATDFRPEDDIPVVGGVSDVAQAIEDADADTVAITAARSLDAPGIRRLAWSLEDSDVTVIVAPSVTDVAGPRIHIRPVAGLPLLYVEQPEFTGGRRVVKTVFDRLGALALFALFAPLLAVLAVLIRLDSPGPVLFRQIRIGRDGRPFTVYKLRSMSVDAEQRQADLADQNEVDGPLFKMGNDPRVTRTGRWLRRFSLDELPQLLNVIRGDMSLVGPRPPLPEEVEAYGDDVRRRLLVPPGMTGLWQVSGRSDLTWDESVRLDLYYVENWSLTGDLIILWKTLRAVVGGPGAY